MTDISYACDRRRRSEHRSRTPAAGNITALARHEFHRWHDEGGGFKTADGIVLPIAGPISAQAVKYGVRPEDVRLDPNGLEMGVIVLEPMGSETQIIGKLGSQPFTAVVRDRIAARPGDKLTVMPDAAMVHLFDRDGMRIG